MNKKIQITPKAQEHIAKVLQNDKSKYFRITVLGGGCSGFQYKFELDDTINIGDHIFEMDGKKLIVDEVSLDLLDGAIVDFKTDLGGSFFQVDNPNASANCGCGASFSI